LALAALLLLASIALRQAQDVALAQGDYDLSWFTVDGDGAPAKAAATSRAAPSANRTQGLASPVVAIPWSAASGAGRWLGQNSIPSTCRWYKRTTDGQEDQMPPLNHSPTTDGGLPCH
jgi:hypothetical protein